MTALADCAACPVLKICDAHITNGTWHHREGVDPCRVEITQDHKPRPTHVLVFDERERMYRPVKIQQYERPE